MPGALFIGKVWPEPTSSAAGVRMIQLVEYFKRFTDIVFVSTASQNEHCYDLTQDDIRVRIVKLNDSTFDEMVNKLSPEFVIFDRFTTEEQFGWRTAQAAPEALRILDTEDLHCLRFARELALERGAAEVKHFLQNPVAYREIASIYRSDISLIISEFEMELLQDFYKVPLSLLHYHPYTYNTLSTADRNNVPGFEEREDFIFVGNFLHAPNADAVRVLSTRLWPKIRKRLPLAQLHIYGPYASQEFKSLHNEAAGFCIHGRSGDIDEDMCTSRVCLAPLRTGAGLKGKLVTAMMNGTPSVTTEIGAEGLKKGRWPGEICAVGDDFVDAAVDLYTNKNKWQKASAEGFSLFNDLFDLEMNYERLDDALNNVNGRLQKHRRRNFIGQMLSYQSNHAALNLGRYLELKGREKARQEDGPSQ